MALWEAWKNCTSPAVLDFPYPSLLNNQYALLLASIVLFYSFVALARICQVYLVPSLKEINKNVGGIRSEIAAGLILAGGSSLPELGIALFSTFLTSQGDIGVNTIVGTSVFNTLAVPAICALIINKESKCDPWIISRDSIMAVISMITLLAVLQNDRIEWSESSCMILIYLAYIAGLHLDELKRLNTKWLYRNVPDGDGECPTKALQLKDCKLSDETLEDYSREGKFQRLSLCLILWPVDNIIQYSLPKPWNYPFSCCVLSAVWVSCVTYILSWMITIIGYKLNLPDALVGLTILAVGFGIPDLLSSISEAKQGNGSKAMSDVLSANTFNILICLGVPWLLKALFISDGKGNQVNINADGILYSILTMFGALLAAYVVLALNRFVLNSIVGWTSIALYAFFIVMVSLFEFNVFIEVNLPLCSIENF